MVKVTDINNLNVHDIQYDNIYKNKLGNQSLNLYHVHNHKLVIQTPVCHVPFGLNKYEASYGTKYSIDLSLKESKNMSQFNYFIEKLDEDILSKAKENCVEWFKKKDLSETDLKKMYRSQLVQKAPYPPLFKVKIPCDSKNNPCCTIFDINKNILDVNSVNKNIEVSAVIELTGIYFIAKEFGVSWKLLQLMIHPKVKLSNYAFIDSDDDDDEVEP